MKAAAAAENRVYDMSMHSNAWSGECYVRDPGNYPCGGFAAGMLPIWKALAAVFDVIFRFQHLYDPRWGADEQGYSDNQDSLACQRLRNEETAYHPILTARSNIPFIRPREMQEGNH